MIFLSGQIAVQPTGDVVDTDDVDAQIDLIMTRIQELLRAADSDVHGIIKLMVYVVDVSAFPRIMEMRRRWFRAPYPADTVVEVNALRHPDALIEIEATAVCHPQLRDGGARNDPDIQDADPYEPWLLSLGFTTRHFHVLSGHASLDDTGRFVPGTFAEQAQVTLDGIRRRWRRGRVTRRRR